MLPPVLMIAVEMKVKVRTKEELAQAHNLLSEYTAGQLACGDVREAVEISVLMDVLRWCLSVESDFDKLMADVRAAVDKAKKRGQRAPGNDAKGVG